MIMMKWRVRREAGCNSSDQEDIRKSLDVLDRVLAEYDDDDGDSWLRSPSSSYNGDVCHDYHHNGRIPNGHRKSGFDYPRSRSRYDVSSSASDSITYVRSNSTHSFQSLPADGSTSLYASSSMITDQLRKVSPPPVPKRNPATRLSSHEDLLFSSDISFAREDKIAKRRSYAEGFNYSSSPRHFLDFLSKSDDDDDCCSPSLSARRGESPKNCTNTSAPLSNLGDTPLKNRSGNDEISLRSSNDVDDLSLTSHRRASSNSPNHQNPDNSQDPDNSTTQMDDVQKSPTVAQRRAKFERRFQQLRTTPGSGDDPDDSYRSRSFPRSIRDVLPKRSVATTKGSCGNSAIEVASCHEGKHVSEEESVRVATDGAPRRGGRILLLDEKFAEVRHLIRTNQITPLATPPPSFMPPPPPKPPRKQRDVVAIEDCPPDVVRQPYSQDCNSLPCDTRVVTGPHSEPGDLKSLPTSIIHNGYLGKNIVDDFPKVLPGDVSRIPLLGFSYSMEEDMSPGIKEILTSSTPDVKSRIDQFTAKSTFNSSVSSLGYSSSQSDLDLHNVSDLKDSCCDKVPVDNLRSQTLPIGMKLSPDFYSERKNGTDCDSLDSYGLKNGSFVSPDDHEDVGGQQHFRSSSAPPIKLLEDDSDKKPKRSIFGMSKKVKNKNDCNGGSAAVKLKTSLDDGIILRRISNLGDEFPIPDFQVNKVVAPQEEKKRRSVWKSILRRK